MKDKSFDFAAIFVLHTTYEGQIIWFCSDYCPSYRLWRTKPLILEWLLSFIPLMKDKSFDSAAIIVLHTAYEGQILWFCGPLCPSCRICENKKPTHPILIQKLYPKIFLCVYGKISSNTFKKIKEHSPPLLYWNTNNANVTFAYLISCTEGLFFY